ncbi:MAG: hypothetical protein AB7J40_03060 [Candidatus Altimarinota bacterium]
MSLLPKLFRLVEKALLRQKRLVMNGPDKKMEEAITNMHVESAKKSLAEQFQELSKAESIDRTAVQAKFQERIQAIRALWQQFIDQQFDQNKKDSLVSGRDAVIVRLQALEAKVNTELDRIFDSATPNLIRVQHTEKYQQFLQALHGEGLLKEAPPAPAPAPTRTPATGPAAPAPAPTPAPSPAPAAPAPAPTLRPRRRTRRPATRAAERAPEATGSSDITDVMDLLRKDRPASRMDAGPIDRVERERERQRLSQSFYTLADQWSGAPAAFTKGFVDRALYQPNQRTLDFMKTSLDHPDQFKDLVRSMYEVFQSMGYPRVAPTSSTYPRQLQNFFENIEGNQFSQETIRSAMRGLLDSMKWQKEVEALTSAPDNDGTWRLLDELESSLNSRKLPTRQQLLQIQNLVGYVERNFLNGKRLTWNDVRSFRGSSRIGTKDIVTLQGHSMEVKNELKTGLNAQSPRFTQSVTTVNGIKHDFDLPDLLSTLQHIFKEYSSSTENNANVDLSILAFLVQERRSEVMGHLNRKRHSDLLKELNVSAENQRRFENFPQALSELLNIRTPSLKKTPEQWQADIEAFRVQRDISDDAYKLLWLTRLYSRTREVNGGVMTITEYANALMNSQDFQVLTAPRENSSKIISRLPVGERGGHLFEYDKYKEKIPSLARIFTFIDSLMNITLNPPAANASSMIRYLEEADREFSTSPNVDTGVGTTPPAARPVFDMGLVENYRALKETNGFFRELIELAKHNTTLSFSELAHSIFTPERTTNHRHIRNLPKVS